HQLRLQHEADKSIQLGGRFLDERRLPHQSRREYPQKQRRCHGNAPISEHVEDLIARRLTARARAQAPVEGRKYIHAQHAAEGREYAEASQNLAGGKSGCRRLRSVERNGGGGALCRGQQVVRGADRLCRQLAKYAPRSQPDIFYWADFFGCGHGRSAYAIRVSDSSAHAQMTADFFRATLTARVRTMFQEKDDHGKKEQVEKTQVEAADGKGQT